MEMKQIFFCASIGFLLSASPCFAFEKTSALSDAVRTSETMEP